MDDVRWLEPDELEAWRHLSVVLLLLPGRLDAALEEHGLNFFEYSVLVVLSSSSDGSRATSELASVTQGSLSRISHAAKRLEKRGLVRRGPDPDDRRVTRVWLTDRGHATLASAAPAHVASVRRAVFDAIGEDRVDDLRAVAASIHGALRPDTTPLWEDADT